MSDCARQNYSATVDDKDLTEPPLPHYRITAETVTLNVTGKEEKPTTSALGPTETSQLVAAECLS